MFKDAFLNDRADSRRPWTVAVSFLAQCLAISIAILIPLLTSADLPATQWMSHLLAAPPMPPAAAPAVAKAAPAPVPKQRFDESEIVAPAVIPEQVAVLVDAPVSSVSEPGITGVVAVPGSVPGGVPGGLLSQLIAVKDVPAPPPLPKVQEAAPKKPVPVGGAVQSAMIVHRVDPVYPQIARRARVSGLVKLEAIIGEDGAIRELRVITGHPLLIRAAIDAVKQWRYRPTLLNKVPVAVITQIEVNFRLGQ